MRTPSLLVDGDISIDWQVLLPTKASAGVSADRALGEGFTGNLSCEAGGAARFAAYLEAAIQASGQTVRLIAPRVPAEAISDPAWPQLPRTFSVWQRVPSSREAGSALAWRMQSYLGDQRAVTRAPAPMLAANAATDAVLLNDQYFGYRHDSDQWGPILDSSTVDTAFVVRLAAPVAQGELWSRLASQCATRTTVVVAANDLRRSGHYIGQPRSWERTWADTARAIRHSPLACVAQTVVTFGAAGACLVREDGSTLLVFDPKQQENDWESRYPGNLATSPLFVAASLALDAALGAHDRIGAIRRGIAASRLAHIVGPTMHSEHGVRRLVSPFASVGDVLAPPSAGNDAVPGEDIGTFSTVELGDVPSEDFSIAIDAVTAHELRAAAVLVVRSGAEQLPAPVPLERVSGWISLDRREIESVRSLQALLREYVAVAEEGGTSRPLSVAVFGPPGAGKSFAVKQLASSLLHDRAALLEFNLSQFESEAELREAFHQVRDAVLAGRFPVAFWDEFDSPLAGVPLGWLRLFLAPMQDGQFLESSRMRPTGHGIFVFAGGTSASMAEFESTDSPEADRRAKKPDFISRLRGHLDVMGPNPRGDDDSAMPLRRALLLRSILQRRAPQLFGGDELGIETDVLTALLGIDRYRHGARSIEAIVEMSALAGKLRFERSSLPSDEQLSLHVDAEAFQRLLIDATEAGTQPVHALGPDGGG